MSNWRPSSSVAVAVRRAELLQRTRDYFARNDVLAVDTPSLSPSAPTDPNIHALSVHDSDFYLHTSPEFHMKRLLAGAFPDIYSICRVFRAAEQGRYHLPEFTMVEWYRHSMDLTAIIADTLQLVITVLERPLLLDDIYERDYTTLFKEIVDLDPLEASVDELASIVSADDSLRSSLGAHRDAWLDLILATIIVPRFDDDGLTVIRHYPASQASLARFCPEDIRVADRFEVYFGKLELANGYVELTDADELARRMDADLQARRAGGLPIIPRDEALLSAHEAGLPDCAGVALGFERLQMIDANTDDIRNVVSFA